MTTTTDLIHVLHVDDDPDFGSLTATYLERQDPQITVSTETRPAPALDRIREADIDCVVSDYDMPDLDGIELLEAVRETHPDLPFILYTGQGSEAVASDAISAGVTDYLEKEAGTEQYELLANRIRNAVDRHRAEVGRAASERRLRRVYERIDDGFMAVNSDWEYTYVNEAGADLLGVSEDAVLGATVWSVFPELAGTAFEDALRTAMDTQQTTGVEAEYPPHDAWYDVAVYPDAGGISVFFRDVTDEKDRDRTLSQAETIYEHAQDAFFLVDVRAEGYWIERVNPAYEALTGVPQAELEERPLVEVVGEDQYDTVVERYEECVAAKEPIEYDERLPIGEVTWWHTKLAPVLRDGEVTQLVGATRDITDRRQREQELERYEAIVENSEDGIYIFDADGYFEFVNQRVVDVSGVPREAWIGEHVSIHTDMGTMTTAETDAIQAGIDEIIEGGAEDVRIEVEPDVPGDVQVLELRLTAFDAAEGPDRVIGFTRDITERKHSERALERRNERLNEFASVVSHDLRNPLTVAAGRLDLAREDGDDEHLEAVAQAHDRMEALIENLLELAREGQRVNDPEPVAVADVVEGCWGNVDTGAATLVTDTEQTIMADPEAIRQLLENLFGNAVEHGGDTVTVGDLPGGFYVVDDGPGIPAEDRNAVFEAGYTTSDEGVGFGLSIVEEIADAHGWRLRLTEGDAGGARFEFLGVDTP